MKELIGGKNITMNPAIAINWVCELSNLKDSLSH